MKTKAIALCLGLLLGGAYTAIILSVGPEPVEEPVWCKYGEYTEEEWEALPNKHDWIYVTFNGTKLVVHVKCSDI